jgi:hypothetical protein
MATTTTNFGWDIPQSTDLVKDGATAIAALGQDIDTALVDLKGGTTGQVLAKASGTDLDYSWTTPQVGDITAVTAGTGISGGGTGGDVTITNSMATAIDAKGDLIAGTGADTFSRLAIGTNDQVLTADSAAATGMKWSSVASPAGGLTLISATTIGSAVSSVEVTGAFSSTYDNYKIVVSGGTTSADPNLTLKFGSTTSGYYSAVGRVNFSGATANFASDNNAANFSRAGASNVNGMNLNCDVLSPNLAKNTFVNGFYVASVTAGAAGAWAGFLNDTTAYTAFTVAPSTGTFTGGTIRVYGYKNS